MSKSTDGINATARVEVTNLYQPRALAVDIDTNGQVGYCAANVRCLCLLTPACIFTMVNSMRNWRQHKFLNGHRIPRNFFFNAIMN